MSLFEYIGVGLAVYLSGMVLWVIGSSILVTQRKRAFNAIRIMVNDPKNTGYILYRKGRNGSLTMSVESRKLKDEYRQFALVMNTINDYWFATGKNIRNFRADHWEF